MKYVEQLCRFRAKALTLVTNLFFIYLPPSDDIFFLKMVNHQFHDDEDTRKNLELFRNQQFLSDFTIIVEKKEFSAHKLLLALKSPYFRSMLINDTKEARESKVEIYDVTPESMTMILDYFYTSSLEINRDNVKDLFMAAFKMQLEPVIQFCIKFMTKIIHKSNCLGILTVADRYNLAKLTKTSFEFCLVHFEDLIEEKEFLQIDEHVLSMIISSDDLSISSECKLFDAIWKWITADYSERMHSFDSLVCHVRFSHIGSPSKLLQIKNESEHAKHSEKFHELVDKSIAFLCLEKFGESQDNKWILGPNYNLRHPLNKQQRIFIVGGWTDEKKSIADVERYNPYCDTWTEVSKMSEPRCGAGVNILENFLYAIGGHDGTNYLKSVEKYDCKADIWSSEVCEMKLERTSVGVVKLDGYIYAIGGQNASGSCANVEKYDPSTNTWSNCAPLNQGRLGAGVAVINDLIFVVGGASQTQNTQTTLDTVECYDQKTGCWSYVASMETSRKHLGCASYDSKLYAVGGRSGSSELDTVECYCPKTDTWESLPRMSEKRSGIGLVQLEGILYAVGGHNGDAKLKLVEAYDPCRKLWTIKAPLNLERLGGGLAAYSILDD